MTSVNVSERMNELTDGMVRSLNATAGGGNGSISEIPVYVIHAPTDPAVLAAYPPADVSVDAIGDLVTTDLRAFGFGSR